MGARWKAAARIPTAEECRENIDSVLAQVINARALRETASDLRQYNAELRELLLETRLLARSTHERRMEAWLDRRIV